GRGDRAALHGDARGVRQAPLRAARTGGRAGGPARRGAAVKVYTRTGDDGTTALFGGGRVPKDDLRVAAYGSVDEANSALGLARASLASEPEGSPLRALDDDLQALQALLFDLGADLATPLGTKARSH